MMGGVPEEHCTDSLATAFSSSAPWSRRLLLRGRREFADIDVYRIFVAEVFWRLKGRVASRFNEERATFILNSSVNSSPRTAVRRFLPVGSRWPR